MKKLRQPRNGTPVTQTLFGKYLEQFNGMLSRQQSGGSMAVATTAEQHGALALLQFSHVGLARSRESGEPDSKPELASLC